MVVGGDQVGEFDWLCWWCFGCIVVGFGGEVVVGLDFYWWGWFGGCLVEWFVDDLWYLVGYFCWDFIWFGL